MYLKKKKIAYLSYKLVYMSINYKLNMWMHTIIDQSPY